jgi:hypothetical protein
VDVVHVSAGFADAASDHDPVVARVVPLRAPAAGDGGGVAIVSIRPNPSSGPAVIGVRGRVTAAVIHDVRGRRVRTLDARTGEFEWDGNDDTGRRVASGVYFVRVAGPGGAAVRRIVRVPARQ